MLLMDRRKEQGVVIGDVLIRVLHVGRRAVKLGIEADRCKVIERGTSQASQGVARLPGQAKDGPTEAG